MADKTDKEADWREELMARGMTLSDLAERSGYSPDDIAAIFDGKKSAPLATFERIFAQINQAMTVIQ